MGRSAPPAAPDVPAPSRAASFVDRMVLPYLRDPGLWPVLFVLVAHLVVAVAIVLLRSVRDGRTSGHVLLVLLLLGSATVARFEWRRSGPGALSVVLLVTWLLGGALALVANHYAVY